MKSLLIAYHSQTGNTKALVDVFYNHTMTIEADVKVKCKHVSEIGDDDFLKFDAFLFASPENFASLSGLMKDLFDRTYNFVREQTAGKPYSTLISCDTDGRGALAQFQKILTGYRMVEAIPGVIVRGELTQVDERKIKEQATHLLLALESGII